MSWAKPQRVIKNSMFYIGLLSFIGMLLWLSIFYVWNNHPQLISEYDKKIPNHYTNKITRLQTRTHKGKSPEDTFKRHQELAVALEGVTKLHKYYNLNSDNQIFMIDYLIASKKYLEAEKIANNWQLQLPNDFIAKFKYAEVLSHIDSSKEISYYESIYQNHKDIVKLNQKYVSLLLHKGFFNKALTAAVQAKRYNRKKQNLSFMSYYRDSINKKYSRDYKIEIPKYAHQINGDGYNVKYSITADKLTNLRFDIDHLSTGSSIQDLHFTIKTSSNTFLDVKANPLHHIIIEDEIFKTSGTDPYVEIELPDELIGTSETLEVIAFFKVTKAETFVLDQITQHPEFKITCSKSTDFDDLESKRFTLSESLNKFTSTIKMPEQSCQYMKIGFPSIKNFNFSNLTINSDTLLLSEENIIFKYALEISPSGYYKVIGDKPYLVLRSEKSNPNHLINLELNLGDEK